MELFGIQKKDNLIYQLRNLDMYENCYESLISGLAQEVKRLEELRKKDPKRAKEEAIKGLQSSGILDENGELKAPYNGQKVHENDFTRGPQAYRKKVKSK